MVALLSGQTRDDVFVIHRDVFVTDADVTYRRDKNILVHLVAKVSCHSDEYETTCRDVTNHCDVTHRRDTNKFDRRDAYARY